MNEISFYPEISAKFSKFLSYYLPEGSKVYYSYNKFLPQMIEEIEQYMGEKSELSQNYVPSLKLDILLGVKIPDKAIRFILLEVKYSSQLALADYSQLVGYLQVAKKIDVGILFLVQKQAKANVLSNDFSDIIRMNNLPMKWNMNLGEEDFIYNFSSGICYYIPNSKIEWISTEELSGINSFMSLSNIYVDL